MLKTSPFLIAISVTLLCGCYQKSSDPNEPDDQQTSISIITNKGVCLPKGQDACISPEDALAYLYNEDFGDISSVGVVTDGRLAKVDAQAFIKTDSEQFAVFLAGLRHWNDSGFDTSNVSSPEIGLAVYKAGPEKYLKHDTWHEYGRNSNLGQFGNHGDVFPYETWGMHALPNGDQGLLLALKSHAQKSGFEHNWIYIVTVEPSKILGGKAHIEMPGRIQIRYSECGAGGPKNSKWTGILKVYQSQTGPASFCLHKTSRSCSSNEEISSEATEYKVSEKGNLAPQEAVDKCPEPSDFSISMEQFAHESSIRTP